jgi:hypothetical protein
MLFLLPTNNASPGSAAPYFLPKAEGCSGEAPFGFACAQRLHGCCPVLAVCLKEICFSRVASMAGRGTGREGV